MKVINIDYNIHYKEDGNYKLYSSYLHAGLGWDYNSNDTYDLDSSVLTFDNDFNYLDKVNFQNLTAYNGAIKSLLKDKEKMEENADKLKARYGIQ